MMETHLGRGCIPVRQTRLENFGSGLFHSLETLFRTISHSPDCPDWWAKSQLKPAKFPDWLRTGSGLVWCEIPDWLRTGSGLSGLVGAPFRTRGGRHTNYLHIILLQKLPDWCFGFPDYLIVCKPSFRTIRRVSGLSGLVGGQV